jgi:hypothetical protein
MNSHKMKIKFLLPTIAIFLTMMTACKKNTEVYNEEYPVANFFSLKLGDSTLYRLDSLEFTVDLQDPQVLNSYLVKEFVEDTLRDNLNQPIWKIVRYINNDTTGKGFWQFLGQYFISIQQYQVDIIENNLRFIKLKAPVRENFSWKGNSFLPNEAYPQYDFSIDNNMAGWNYSYLNVGTTESLSGNNISFSNICTVEHVNQNININPETGDVSNFESFSSNEVSVEKYAVGKGLIYKEQKLWEFQPTRGKKIGYILKLWRINQ